MSWHARAPVRVDFAGGWSDVPTFARHEGGGVVNTAVALYVHVDVLAGEPGVLLHAEDLQIHERIRSPHGIVYDGKLDLHKAAINMLPVTGGVEIISRADVPAGSGLGASGALDVALLAALAACRRESFGPTELAELGFHLEATELGLLGGRQDQYAAALGGFHELSFSGAGVEAVPLAITVDAARDLEGHSTLVYTGESHFSSRTHARVWEAYESGDATVVEALKTIRDLASPAASALSAGEWARLAEVVGLSKRPSPHSARAVSNGRSISKVSRHGSGRVLAATPDDLVVRRRAIAGSGVLQALATRLRTLVAPLLAGPVYLPDQKAQLSQTGGVCARDGSRLAFDPLSPSLHRCPACATEFTGEQHHRAWILRYHLWLSERAAHLAALGAVQGDVKCARRAAQLLDAYAARYRDYPNQDNVLGPTRLFFSTYLESIWLSQLVFAASLIDLVESGEGWHGGERERVRSMVAESVGIIGSFDEMWSNRQVWNNAAMIAAGRWLDEVAVVDRGLRGAHGLYEQMSRCVSSDGFWHEGENYHFFALRGMLLAAEALRSGGLDLYTDGQVGARLRAMYHAPFLSVLPDLSLPARSDSPFGVSLRQQRFAELWEIGRARTGDGAVEAFLAELYDMDGPSGDDFGSSDIAELETHRPAQEISRACLGWKAFMWMDPSEPRTEAGSWRVGSQLLVEDGLAVLRSGPSRYASLECGPGRGGHGHPDLLHASLFWHVSWLADLGAGSYVSPSLAWYRSALAHNAPGVARVGQRSRGGFCAAFDQGDAWSWCRGVARNLFGGSTRAMRTLVVGPDYVVDVVDVEVPDEMEIDFPIHP